MEILKKVAYLKGLAEGMGLDTKSKDGKLFSVMIDLLDDIALELKDIRDEQAELEEGLDAVSDDLSDVESYLYEEGDDDEEDEDEDEDSQVYEVTCPDCNEQILFDEDVLEEGGVVCPNCGRRLEFDLRECPGCCGACEPEDSLEDDPDAPRTFKVGDGEDLPF